MIAHLNLLLAGMGLGAWVLLFACAWAHDDRREMLVAISSLVIGVAFAMAVAGVMR